MEIDCSWKALMNPGSGMDFFSLYPLPKITEKTRSFDVKNAWWLAELSRLSYRSEAFPEGATNSHQRKSNILKRVKLKRVLLLCQRGIKCEFFEFAHHSDKKVGALIFRGTSGFSNWAKNLNALPTRWHGAGKVHRGFTLALEAVWQRLENHLAKVDFPFFCAGHSLGGALAILAATRSPNLPLAVYTYGTPRVGDDDFIERVGRLNLFRIVNHRDIVPMLPPPLCFLGFKHCGELHYFTSTGDKCVNPNSETVYKERESSDRKFYNSLKAYRWFDPPEFLYDHSPVNYVRLLENQLGIATNTIEPQRQ